MYKGVVVSIQSFGSKTTAAVFADRCPKGFPADLFNAAIRKSALLDAAAALDVMARPPGNRLEAWRGDRAGQHSIRINDQFRICFRWTQAGPTDVEITDYH